MVRRIYKYTLEPDRRQLVMMPDGAKLLNVLVQNEYPVLYAEVDPEAEHVARVFAVVTTGDYYDSAGKVYVGSVVLQDWFVAHVFEQPNGQADPVDTTRLEDFAQIKRDLIDTKS